MWPDQQAFASASFSAEPVCRNLTPPSAQCRLAAWGLFVPERITLPPLPSGPTPAAVQFPREILLAARCRGVAGFEYKPQYQNLLIQSGRLHAGPSGTGRFRSWLYAAGFNAKAALSRGMPMGSGVVGLGFISPPKSTGHCEAAWERLMAGPACFLRFRAAKPIQPTPDSSIIPSAAFSSWLAGRGRSGHRPPAPPTIAMHASCLPGRLGIGDHKRNP